MRSMKYGSMLLALLMMVMMPLQSHAADDDTKGLFVVVTTTDAQTQMMAMVFKNSGAGQKRPYAFVRSRWRACFERQQADSAQAA